MALALHVWRTPAETRQFHTGDTVERAGQTGRVIAVSGEFVSVWGATGRQAALTRQPLEGHPW